jgi:phenylpropionate dioxygenase-like ring-hydroxylating dioxygenase large terminal subunit
MRITHNALCDSATGKGINMFIRNCWYVAAWPHEITDQPLARMILGEPLVLYRQSDATVVALLDRCAHRSMPLSLGKVCGDRIVCSYHGMAYDKTGRCVRIPAQDTIPTAAKVRSYPVVEHNKAVWIWMGDAALADPEAIPEYPFHESEKWAHKPSYSHIKGHYELLHDNLIDLSHVGWVHANTIGGTPDTHSLAAVNTHRDGKVVTVRRYLPDSVPPPTYVRAVGFTGNIDRWMEIVFQPALVQVYAGANNAGDGVDEANHNDLLGARIFNGVTPETEHTTHYFWSAAHNFKIDNPAVTEAFYKEILATFMEDKAVMEAQYERMVQLPAERTIDIRSDAGGVQARRVIQDLLNSEMKPAGIVKGKADIVIQPM